jgi:hypothetical protein
MLQYGIVFNLIITVNLNLILFRIYHEDVSIATVIVTSLTIHIIQIIVYYIVQLISTSIFFY